MRLRLMNLHAGRRGDRIIGGVRDRRGWAGSTTHVQRDMSVHLAATASVEGANGTTAGW
jgi:hypothetical protein